MVDGTRESLYRMPIAPSGSDGARRKQDTNAPTGAGTIGQIGGLPDLPAFQHIKDGHGSQNGNGDAPPGAPELPAPKHQYAPSEMAIMVSVLIAKMDDAQADTEQNGLKLDDTQRQDAYKRSNDAIAKSVKKLAEAKHKQKILGPLATIAKVFAGIAAIALTIASGGAAAPLAIALIAYTVVDTSLTIADSISRAAGGPALDLNSLLTKGFTEAAKKMGASDKEAATIGKWCAFGVQAAIAIATIAVSFKNIATLAKSGVGAATGGLASKLSSTAFKATKITGIACQAISGATNTTAGGLGIAVAIDTYDAEKAKANKAQFDAAAAALTEMIRNTLDRLQQIAQDLSSGMQGAAQQVSNIGDTNLAITGGNSMV